MKSPCCEAEMKFFKQDSRHGGFIHRYQAQCTECGTWYACVLAKEGNEKNLHI